jgi:hypothetical protein
MAEETLKDEPGADLEETVEVAIPESADVASMQAEIDRLRQQVDEHQATAETQSHAGRRWAVSLLIALGVILLAVANVVFWVRGTVLSTNGWVAAVGPLSRNETIANALGIYVVGEVFETLDVASMISNLLPGQFQAVSGPLAALLQDLGQDAVATVVQTDQFNAVWVAANRAVHATAMEVLRGRGDLAYLREGQLTIDLSGVLDFVQGQFDLGALGLDPGEGWGKIVLMESRQVAMVQEVLKFIDSVGLVVPLLALGTLLLAWLISMRRRRAVLWIGVGTAIIMAVSLIVFALVQPAMLVAIADPFARVLAGEVVGVVTRSLYWQTFLILIIGVLLAVGAALAGPSERAVAIRTGARNAWARIWKR